MHDHGGATSPVVHAALAAPFCLAALLYCAGVLGERRRGRDWPWPRTLAWLVGLALAAFAFLRPLMPGPQGFVDHMSAHLMAGMLAPVLLVVASPTTLALRSLPVRRARQLARALRTWPVRIVSLPLVAAALNVGGMWLIYAGDLFAWMQDSVLIHMAVMTHVLAAGVLFTAAVIPFDPSPHQQSYPMRLAALVVVLAAHGILAKWLYAVPPPGVGTADGRAGALLMYYGGDLVEAAIIVILCARWYRQAGRRLARAVPIA